MSQVDARKLLVDRLRIDLIGPTQPDETLSDRPSDQYLSGILYPQDTPIDPEEDDGMAVAGGSGEDEADDGGVDSSPMFAARRPASMGISFAVRPTGHAQPVIQVRIRTGTYNPVDGSRGAVSSRKTSAPGTVSKRPQWQRTDHNVYIADLTLPVPGAPLSTDLRSYGLGGLQLYVQTHPAGRNTRDLAVTVALVNQNQTNGEADARVTDETHSFFQTELELEPARDTEFVTRSSRRFLADEDASSMALIYRDAREYAVGHTCSADWEEERKRITRIRSTWLPTRTVQSVSAEGDGAFRLLREHRQYKPLSAKWLGSASAEDLCSGLNLLPQQYSDWLDNEEKKISSLTSKQHREQAAKHIKACRQAADRMLGSIRLLRTDEMVRTSFQYACRALVGQRKWAKKDEDDLTWRPFQLGFQLLCLESLANPKHPDRCIMDLLWFPTGGGKTEAYLALTAFTIFFRRIRSGGKPSSAGVAVLMRYTLRLLTIQQFQRAANLICACEYVRRELIKSGKEPRLGSMPISIGLWVGGSATPNTFEEACAIGDDSEISFKQLADCPCCHNVLFYDRDKKRKAVLARCTNKDCKLGRFPEPLPVWTVDEDIYREGPSLLIATVDKFAQITRKLETATLFGLGTPRREPPELIIQDELHLISGPLGTIAGLYEIAVDRLCESDAGPAKIMGSTATIRRASDQVRALFCRSTFQFPPPCLDASNSCFAVHDTEAVGRQYVGLSSVGRSPKFALAGTFASLLQSAVAPSLTDDDRDPYYTLVAYFNSLRELGGAHVLMLDDVNSWLKDLARRHQEEARQILDVEEMTSRRKSSEIPELLKRLQYRCDQTTEETCSVLLASNMLSVGVDIPRLGLMVVNGQPKGIAEYIQATSRVGRGLVPGLVITLYNNGKVRDRAHFEAFRTWHATLYREVEPTSVTPFAPRARDRALHAVLVALVRHLVPGMQHEPQLTDDQSALDAIVRTITQRVSDIRASDEAASDEAASVQRCLEDRLHTWRERRKLNEYWDDRQHEQSLLLSAEKAAEMTAVQWSYGAAWPTPNSMRQVEPGTMFRMASRLKPRPEQSDEPK